MGNPYDDPSGSGIKMLADAWDKSQVMMLDGVKQLALLAAVLIAFKGAMLKPPAVPTALDKVAIIAFAASVLVCVAVICTNAFTQQQQLFDLTKRAAKAKEWHRTKSDYSEEEKQGASDNLIGLRYLVQVRPVATALVGLQLLCFTIGMIISVAAFF